MQFDMADEAGFAETAEFGAAPRTRWNYTNGNTMLLARMIRDQAGGDDASVLRFAHRELFDKLGMEHVTLEFDADRGRTSARDWARFGQLYLDDGVVGGERILSEGWVDYSARLAPGQRNPWLRRRLLDQSRHDRRSRQAHRARHAARLLHGARHPGAIHRDRPLGAASGGAARHGARPL
jgi:CubicO group peptidase (beta-lactamase class C family)